MARVVIVDDNPNARKLLRDVLEHEGHFVIEHHNGAEALAAAERDDADLVITDSCMPGMSGVQFVAALRRLTRTLHTPIIFHSASDAESEIRKAAAAYGIARILAKPCPAKVLLDEIASALSAPPQESRDGVSEKLRAKIPAYLDYCKSEAAAIESALAIHDLTLIEQVGHNLKGTGSCYGLDRITQFGDRLEAAAKAGDRTELAEQSIALSRYLGAIQSPAGSEGADEAETSREGSSLDA